MHSEFAAFLAYSKTFFVDEAVFCFNIKAAAGAVQVDVISSFLYTFFITAQSAAAADRVPFFLSFFKEFF